MTSRYSSEKTKSCMNCMALSLLAAAVLMSGCSTVRDVSVPNPFAGVTSPAPAQGGERITVATASVLSGGRIGTRATRSVAPVAIVPAPTTPYSAQPSSAPAFIPDPAATAGAYAPFESEGTGTAPRLTVEESYAVAAPSVEPLPVPANTLPVETYTPLPIEAPAYAQPITPPIETYAVSEPSAPTVSVGSLDSYETALPAPAKAPFVPGPVGAYGSGF